MRYALIIAVCMIASCAEADTEESLLKAGGDQAALIIDKAYEIILGANVFTGKGIGTRMVEPGVMGAPTEECWALTVIVRYDENASKRIDQMFEFGLNEEPVPILYCVLALCLIDQSNVKDFPDDRFESLLDREIDVVQGCVAGAHTFGNVLETIRTGDRQRFLFPTLHRLYQTSRASHAK